MNQKELEHYLQSCRGFYTNGFFHIFIDGEFNPMINEISTITDRGTSVHEYIHYIQNIGTLWGLYESMTRYEHLIEFKQAIAKEKEIKRPFVPQISESLQKKYEYIRFGNGFSKYTDIMVDTSKPMEKSSRVVNVNDKKEECISITFTDIHNNIHKIDIGAFIIKESMAALYQELIDKNATHTDLPYNFVKLFAQKNYPRTASDPAKLICCCHVSLFSMNPGLVLIKALEDMEVDDSINGFEYFSHLVHYNIITTKAGKTYSMADYFSKMVNGFKERLSANILAPIDYIGAALERMKLDGKYYPILSVLYEDDGITEENFSEIIGYYGIPYIQAKNGLHYPQSTTDNKEAAMDVLELIVHEAIFLNLTKPENLWVCPLYYMCKDSPYEKEECFTAPWSGGMCSYKIISDSLGLDKIKISI